MADTPTVYRNRESHFPDQEDQTHETYGGGLFGGQNTYGAYSITRARTRYKNQSRFKDEEIN